MSILMTLRIALKALNRNKMRTVLTMLGMIIGVGAVITMVALGAARRRPSKSRSSPPAPTSSTSTPATSRRAACARARACRARSRAEDATALRARARHSVRLGRRQLARPDHRRQPELVDPGPGHRRRLPADSQLADQVRQLLHAAGRRSAAKVAVLGTVVAETLFGPDVDPTGEIIRIRNQPFKVIGVMTSKGQGAFGQDQDDTVFAPYTTVQKKLQGMQHINNITVVVRDAGHGAGRGGHQRGAPRSATSSWPATRTTSRSARRRKSPASAPRRRGR